MRVLVAGKISTSRKFAAVETGTDPVKGARISRVEMRKEMGPEQTLNLLLYGTIGRVQVNWWECISYSRTTLEK